MSNKHPISPQRLHNFRKHAHKIKFPAFAQPKIDGLRVIAHINKKGEIELISRQRNVINNLPHINKELKRTEWFKNPNVYLDGELFSPSFVPEQFKSINRISKLTEKKKEKIYSLQFYVFDMFHLKKLKTPFQKRYSKLKQLFKNKRFKYIHFIKTKTVANKTEFMKLHKKYVKQGFEGSVIRNKHGVYQPNYRTYHAQKYKDYFDHEFKIVGYKEGKGRDKGTVVWECECRPTNKTVKKTTFFVRPMGSHSFREELFKNAKQYIGKQLTVRYHKLSEYGCPIEGRGITYIIYKNNPNSL